MLVLPCWQTSLQIMQHIPTAAEVGMLNDWLRSIEKRVEVLETAIKISARSDNERLNALESKLSKVREVYEQALKVL